MLDRPFIDTPRLPKLKWVEPKWMCTVSFAEWTNEGRLRQPVFHGLIDPK
jgi:bifunctional non-homologous end joining protein LigD